MYAKQKLIKHILELSESDNFETARLEWKALSWTEREPNSYCPCGHAIIERCYIQNIRTGKVTYVGNCCVKKFISTEMALFFKHIADAVRGKRVTEDVISVAYLRDVINEWEYVFLLDMLKKKRYTARQHLVLSRIEKRIVHHFSLPIRIIPQPIPHP